jgi:DNA-binding LytR/AlgR family response regulator
MFRIAICDDMQSHAAELSKMLISLAGEIPVECEVDVFRSFKALQKAMSENTYRLLFLETQLGGIGGIDFARRLRMIDEEIDIVFCSSESDSALAAYTVYPVGYLTKPVDRKKLRDVFRYVTDKYRQKPSIVLRGIDGGERMICVDDILYIEVFGAELDVHCKRGVVLCSGTLVEAGDLLSSTDFYRSHRSFIVNLRYTTGIERYQFRMVNGDTVAVAKNRYAEVKAAFEEYAGVKRSPKPGDERGLISASAKKVDEKESREQVFANG